MTTEKGAPSLKVLAESKTEGVQKTTQFQVDPRIIEIEEGFNRPIDRAHVESMKAAKKAGATFPPVFVRVENGHIIMVDGHHRLTADLELIAEGVAVKRIDCMQFRGNDADRIVLSLTTAQGKPLTPLEAGLRYKKLLTFGWTPAEIGERVGKTRQHVDDMVLLANAPSAVQTMIQNNEVAANTALPVVREHGDGATQVLQAAQSRAAASGKAKVTKKTLSSAQPKRGISAEIENRIRAEERERCAALCASLPTGSYFAKRIRELT